MPRTKGNIVEHAAILPQRDFAFRAAIQIIKDGFGYAFAGYCPQIGNANHARRSDGSR